MINIQRLSSYLDLKGLSFNSEDTKYTKLGKVAAGIGVAGLAIVSWKLVVAGGIVYSTYKGSQYLQNRHFERRALKRYQAAGNEEAVPVDERHVNAPVDAGHNAHADQQPGERHEAEPLIPDDTIDHLRRIQDSVETWHGKRVLEAIITHPKVIEKGKNVQWFRKMVGVHGKWSKRTLGLSLPVVQAFRKIKGCFGGYQEKPINEANQ